MKRILTLAAVLFALTANAQFNYPTATPMWYYMARIANPSLDTTTYSASQFHGALQFRQQPGDTGYYFSTGKRYIKVGTGDFDLSLYYTKSQLQSAGDAIVNYGNVANIGAVKLLGRYSNSSGVAQEISVGSGLTLNSSTGVLTGAISTASNGLMLTGSDVRLGGTLTTTTTINTGADNAFNVTKTDGASNVSRFTLGGATPGPVHLMAQQEGTKRIGEVILTTAGSVMLRSNNNGQPGQDSRVTLDGAGVSTLGSFTLGVDDASAGAYKLLTRNNATGRVETASPMGVPNGIATLDASGKVPLSQINDALLGAVIYQGTYNASTNTPALPTAASGNKGWYYVVSTAGIQQSLTLNPGDWVISNGSTWGKVDNNNAVTSVFGRTGAVTGQAGDYSTSQVTEGSNLYFTNARARSALSATAPLTYNSSTGGFSIPAAGSGVSGYVTNGDQTFTGSKWFENKVAIGTSGISEKFAVSDGTSGVRLYINPNTSNSKIDAGAITSVGVPVRLNLVADPLELQGSMVVTPVGTGTSFQVNGSQGGSYFPTNTNITLDNTRYILRVTTGGITVILPTAGSAGGRIYKIRNETASSCTISAVFIDGVSTTTIPGNTCWEIYSDQTAWRLLSRSN